MHLITSGSLLLAAIALGVLLWNLVSKRREHRFYWHRLSDCNNFYVTVITPDGITHVIDMFIVDKKKIKKVEIDEVKPNYYRIRIPRGTTLNKLRIDVSVDGVKDNTVVSLFAGITKSEKLDPLFIHKEDKDSCLEMFGYLKQTLLYN